jgi:hypothetical protein
VRDRAPLRGKLSLFSMLTAVPLVAIVTSSATAREQTPLSDVPAARQYLETVPSSSGPALPGSGKERRQLPADVRSALAGGRADAPLLDQLASRSDLGAPVKRLGQDDHVAPGALSAVVTAAADAGKEPLWLLIASLIITGLAWGTAGYRRARNSPASG